VNVTIEKRPKERDLGCKLNIPINPVSFLRKIQINMFSKKLAYFPEDTVNRDIVKLFL